MTEYPFNFDRENFEIFPKEIWSNKLIVFHGTTTFHSQSIESLGFNKNFIPFNISFVEKLVETLKMDGII